MSDDEQAGAGPAITVYKYGTPAKSTGQLPDEVRDQFRLAHQLRNALVAVHQGYEAAVAQAWVGHPDVEAAQRHLDATQPRARAVHPGRGRCGRP